MQGSALNKVAYILVFIGALNWGLVGIGNLSNTGNWDLVNLIFTEWLGVQVLSDIIYLVVGIAAVVAISTCMKCKKGGSGKMGGGDRMEM